MIYAKQISRDKKVPYLFLVGNNGGISFLKYSKVGSGSELAKYYIPGS